MCACGAWADTSLGRNSIVVVDFISATHALYLGLLVVQMSDEKVVAPDIILDLDLERSAIGMTIESANGGGVPSTTRPSHSQ